MLSIALCTYNGELFLQEQLDSIAQQTLLPSELVVCDDCSSDDTIAILEKFRSRAPFPVHIYQNNVNLGSTKNFEQAIELCTGDIIALSDQDDVWKPNKLERLKNALQANPEAGYAFSDADLVDENLQPLGSRLWETLGFQEESRKLFVPNKQFRFLARSSVVTGATMAFRVSAGRMAMPFPVKEEYWIHDGWIALISSAVGKNGILVDDSLMLYRQHPKQQIGVSTRPKGRRSLVEMYFEMKARHQILFEAWEENCLRVLSLKDILHQLQGNYNSSILEQNLLFLQQFETHYLKRKKIMMSPKHRRYGLILREAFSGRYTQFSNSWRSIFRDLLF